ncbi:MAG: energy-coupling factor transporter transmembrane protein EcfT [Eubacterium sp.]|nr:energy-coupling factor transporter transmembrane protein EcfT [Eubacterium sp.]
MNRRFSVLRSYDPRTKLHILLMYFVLTLAAWNAPAMVVSVLAAALIIYISRENLQTVISMSLVLLILNVILGVVCIIAMPIITGIYVTIKLLLFTFVYLLIMKGMKPGEMLDGLALGFGLRAKTAKVLMIILDFIPKVYREKKRGRKAQRARGISPDGGGSHFFSRIRQEALLAIPNIKYAYTRSKRQAEAMTRRQYHSTIRRSPVYELKLTAVDKIATIIFMLLMLATIILTLML